MSNADHIVNNKRRALMIEWLVQIFVITTLPENNLAPETLGLEEEFPPISRCYLSFREGNFEKKKSP